ncbi:hypothetical protein M427DRAFT_97381 [Gonapodya prolifera JEL478]|uniref:DUF6987 domain-containing protein n=1 Tax=Gonapodya prolifera (strain JEL478) TaxID=1344416 RepID=A0A139AJV9_GONPJ|nr:hypothetical protein M427DRAFT_97381 [Gonapodya prolifera JEL478]|eukprot:KXS17039.1 hypothetical protein M427DRAFT_97381 [Gonapodya prolifera JEL478]
MLSDVDPNTTPTVKTTKGDAELGKKKVDALEGDKNKAKEKQEPTEEDLKHDKEVATRMSEIIEGASEKLVPVCKMIRNHIENFTAAKEEERNEDDLIEAVKPLLEQAEKELNQTFGAIKGADPDGKVAYRAKQATQDHTATPEEQRLAAALRVLVQEVGGTIEWAKDKLESFPKAKKDLGPLFDALAAPIVQIVGGVGMVLAGVLNLLAGILSGLGLDSLLRGLINATGLGAIFKGVS